MITSSLAAHWEFECAHALETGLLTHVTKTGVGDRRWHAVQRLLLGLSVVCAALSLSLVPTRAERITVFAAASLKNVLDEAAADWSARTGHTAVLSYAGSSRLARQIQRAAPADVFVSANAAWMDVLARDGLIRVGTRRDIAGNRLVLIAHGADAAPIALNRPGDLAARLGDGRLAMALVDAVPAGIYGKAALKSLGLWDTLAKRVAQTDNVRAALALVARGETAYGIVYQSDAAASDRVRVVATFPEGSHPAIVYPAAVLKDTSKPDVANSFLDELSSPAAAARFRRYQFRAPADGGLAHPARGTGQ